MNLRGIPKSGVHTSAPAAVWLAAILWTVRAVVEHGILGGGGVAHKVERFGEQRFGKEDHGWNNLLCCGNDLTEAVRREKDGR